MDLCEEELTKSNWIRLKEHIATVGRQKESLK